MKHRTRLTGVILLSILGIADSWYLAEHALTNTALSCGIDGALSGCNVVAQSPYSHFFGIPLGVYGLAFYGAILLLGILVKYFHLHVPYLRRTLAFVGVFGMAASLYLLGLQFFVIDALCIYCLGSFMIATGIFALTHPLWKHHQAHSHITHQNAVLEEEGIKT